MRSVISLDYETFYSSDYSVATMGNELYCRSDLFDPYLVSVADGNESWAGRPQDLNWAMLQGQTLLSHNAGFDQHVTRRLEQLGRIPELNPEAWHCTANLTSYLCNRRALDKASEFLLGVKPSKELRSWMKNKRWADAIAAGKNGELIQYAINDAKLCWQLWDKFSPQWPEDERQLSALTIDAEHYGVAVDQSLLDEHEHVAETALIRCEANLPWITQGKKPTSLIAIAEQCRALGIPCPPIKADDAEGFDDWEERWSPEYPWVQAVATWRVVNKFLATLRVFKERLRPDGTVPVPTKYYGAHTGRWAGTNRLNFLNFRKEPIYLDEQYQVIQDARLAAVRRQVAETGDLPDFVAHSLDIRRILIPRPGHKFILSDLEQIEPRVLAWFGQDWEFLDKVAAGMNVYEAHARGTMGWEGGVLKQEDRRIYDLAKIRVLQLGYQSGWRKLQFTAWKKLQLELSDAEAQKIVVDFRAQSPKITKVWDMLGRAFKMAVNQKEDMFDLELPSGRVLHYGKPSVSTRVRLNEDTGLLEKVTVTTADVGGRRRSFYGGALTENLVQATARDVFCAHLLALHQAGHRVMWHTYDEAIIEAPMDTKPEEIKQIMSVSPPWLSRCPVSAEVRETTHYLK